MPSATRVLAFLLVFSSLFSFALALTIATEFSDEKWIERLVIVGEGLGRLTLVAIAMAFILVEGVPMLAEWARKQWRKEAEERGRAQERKIWQDWRRNLEEWEQRKADAESEGRAFTEPRPAPPSDE